jgi:hypothetical protein
LFKNHEEFPKNNSRALNWQESLSKRVHEACPEKAAGNISKPEADKSGNNRECI